MNKKLKNELKKAFFAPNVTKKNEFLKSFPYPKISMLEFFTTQLSYIRKRLWCLSIVIVAIAITFLKLSDNANTAIGVVSSALPLLSLLLISEIQKSTSFNMAEMEMSCKHNLGEITLIRFSLIGSFHLLILFAILVFSASIIDFSFIRTALYIVTPFLLSSALSLFISNRFQTREILYICGAVTGFIIISTMIAAYQSELFYSQKFAWIWGIAFIFLAVLLLLEIRKFIKRTEELSCSLPLTA